MSIEVSSFHFGGSLYAKKKIIDIKIKKPGLHFVTQAKDLLICI